jgi:ribose transport system substrate-binding protein
MKVPNLHFAAALIFGILPLGLFAATERAYTVAVIPMGTTHEYWKLIHAGALKAQAELRAEGVTIDIIWKGPLREDDRDQQVQVVENSIGRQVSGIVLAPLDYRALAAPVEQAKQAGIPVVIVDSGLQSTAPVSFIATDNRAGWRRAGSASCCTAAATSSSSACRSARAAARRARRVFWRSSRRSFPGSR